MMAANTKEKRMERKEVARKGPVAGSQTDNAQCAKRKEKVMRKVIEDWTGSDRRLRVRRVDEHTDELRNRAIKLGRPLVACRNGGDVCNSYGYPAETEGLLVVAFPDGSVIGWLVRLPANKVTPGGVCAAVDGDFRPFGDDRFGPAPTDKARNLIITDARKLLSQKGR